MCGIAMAASYPIDNEVKLREFNLDDMAVEE